MKKHDDFAAMRFLAGQKYSLVTATGTPTGDEEPKPPKPKDPPVPGV